jgi:hypothetical protein
MSILCLGWEDYVINVVIIFTPYQEVVWCEIKEEVKGKVILFDFANKKTSSEGTGLYFYRKTILFYLALFFVVLYTRIFSFRLFCAHPAQAFSNLLFFSNKVKEINILEDGILNYYGCELCHIESKVKVLSQKKIISYFIYNYFGHLSGIENKHTNTPFIGWFSNPKDIYHSNLFQKINKIEFRNISKLNEFEETKDIILILDQPIEELFDSDFKDVLLNNMMALLDSTSTSNIYVKPHPRGGGLFSCSNEYKLIDDPAPVEYLIGKIKPRLVISFISSALVTIKVICPDIHCVSLGLDNTNLNNKFKKDIKKIFESFNVQIL